jgi:hypothetical protein
MSNREDDFEIETTGFNVPNAPAPKPKQQEDLPDWARITSSIAEEETEQEETAVEPPREYVPPMGKFGSPIEDLSDDELFVPEEPSPETQVERAHPTPIEEPKPSVREQLPREQVSRVLEENDEEMQEEELEEATPTATNRKVETTKNKILRAKVKPGKPAKQARKVKKAVLEGLEDTETEILAPRGRMAGNRWKLIGLRTAVWGTLGMVILAGVFAIVGPRGPSLNSITQQVLSNINRNNFPLEAGQQVAARFAKEYMNIPIVSSGKFRERSDALSAYIIGSGIEEGRIVNFSADREQRVIGEPILAMPAELVSDNHVVYTFAIQVFQPAVKGTEETPAKEATAPTWVYLAVPMAADENGAIGVAGAPAFVPQPAIANRAESITFQEDSDAARESKSQIEKFMLHWAASDEVSLRPYLVAGVSTPSARAGLGGTMKFKSLSGYRVAALPKDFVQEEGVAPTCSAPEFEAPCRTAYMEATWNFQGIEVTQKYRLVVLFDGQNWRVIDIRGTNFGKIGG